MRKLVSIGGWCGPGLILGKLGLRSESYPFDFSRVTMDGIVKFTRDGFDQGFFPEGGKPFRPQCVGPWVLYRSRYCAFAHFDLNDPVVWCSFERKISRWNQLIDGVHPVTFLRTVSACDPSEEIPHIQFWCKVLKERNPKLDFRIVVIVHDQGYERTAPLKPIAENISCWTLEYDVQESSRKDATLFDKTQKGYETIIRETLVEANWPQQMYHDESPRAWRSHNNIALINGIASVRGTCKGVVKPLSATITKENTSQCHWCNTTNQHSATREEYSDICDFTEEEDAILLLYIYKMMQGDDRVEVVEDAATKLNKTAHAIIHRAHTLCLRHNLIAPNYYLES